MQLVDSGTYWKPYIVQKVGSKQGCSDSDWWEDKQKDNMRYEAFTRAKETLILVKIPSKKVESVFSLLPQYKFVSRCR